MRHWLVVYTYSQQLMSGYCDCWTNQLQSMYFPAKYEGLGAKSLGRSHVQEGGLYHRVVACVGFVCEQSVYLNQRAYCNHVDKWRRRGLRWSAKFLSLLLCPACVSL